MLIRATIVLLAVLNLGAAAWWLWRPAPVEQPFEQPAGVPRLVLLEELVPAVQAPPPATQTPATPPPASPSSVLQAAELPGGQPRCEGAAGEARGWRVYLPPAENLATAEATARRIAAAGFSDYLVLRDGDSANGISLGLYATEAAAQRRTSTLRAGGFAARCARIPATTPA